jgi:hypothetical protein
VQQDLDMAWVEMVDLVQHLHKPQETKVLLEVQVLTGL